MQSIEYSMNLVSLHVQCVSLLPAWDPYSPIVRPAKVFKGGEERHDATSGNVYVTPEYASRFMVTLRMERTNWFYIAQVFGLTIMITITSFLGILIPLDGNLHDRLGLYAAGILTLTSFKYAVGDQLPSVPYATMFDYVMLWQFFTLVLCAAESLIAYRFVTGYGSFRPPQDKRVQDMVRTGELLFFFFLLISWGAYWLWLAGKELGLLMGKTPLDWLTILCNQEYQAADDEIEDFDQKKDRGKIGELTESLAEIFKNINETRTELAIAAEKGHGNMHSLKAELVKLQEQRKAKEEELTRVMQFSHGEGKVELPPKSISRRPESPAKRKGLL